MIGRRRAVTRGQASVLPPTHVARWTAWLALWLVIGAAGLFLLRFEPTVLLGDKTEDTAVTTVRVAIATIVPVALLTLGIHAQWRMRLERLAATPGPLLVYPIRDLAAGTVPDADGAVPETARAEAVRALLQRRLLHTQLQRSTAIPSGGGSSEFLKVVENAGGSLEGFWGAVLRLSRFLSPASCYEVRCTIVDPTTVVADEDDVASRPCALLVELTRLPRVVVPPKIVRARTWEDATDRAGDWLVATVLPRTRKCVLPPWTLWQGLHIPVRLFQDYQRFRTLRDREDPELGEPDYEQALEVLDDALERDPTNLALRLDRGKVQEQQHDHLAALETYEGIIARAARLDRRLAYLRFGPPTRDRRSGSLANPRWHDVRRAPGLDPRHPVVYTARYRYALLLGLGSELAGAWDEAFYEGEHDYSTLRRRFAETYHEPMERLRSQIGEHVERVFGVGLTSTLDSATLIDRIFDVSRPCPDEPGRQALIEVFLTTMGVWEVEHLIIERLGAATARRYRRAHREIIPDQSLRLLLPRAILRRALALHRLGVPDDQLRLAESSMIYPIDEPVVEPQLRGLLANGWPSDGHELARFIRVVKGRGRGSLRTWHVHYNAACNLATLLKWPTVGDLEERRQVVRAIVVELEKSVACGDLDYVASTSDWVAEQDPDLAEARTEEEFRWFRAQVFGARRAAAVDEPV